MARLPDADALERARDATIPDVLPGPGDPPLRVLFCGINPGLVSAATGHHFARPGNRFWPVLHSSGFTPRLLCPDEQGELAGGGRGRTKKAPRAPARPDEHNHHHHHADEIVAGGERLRALVAQRRPRWLAVVGIGAYRTAFGRPKTTVGEQEAGVWVLPNPSGLNVHWSREAMVAEFARLRARSG